MKTFIYFVTERENTKEHHASVIPLTGFSPISHMGHALDLGSAMKKLPGEKHIGISSKSDLYSDEDRSNILDRQWKQPDIHHHIVKSGGDTVAKAFNSLPNSGKRILHILVGHDRKDFADGLKKSLEAGKIKEMGNNKWDDIHIHHPEDTDRSHGMSGTNLRKSASEGDIETFHKHLGPMFSREEVEHHMEKIRSGLEAGQLKVKRPGSKIKIKEDIHHNGLFKVIFVVGGPNSGKDIVIREFKDNYDSSINEMNLYQAQRFCTDKSKETGSAILINGSSYESEKIIQVKECLEELGYTPMMVFVNTSNNVSFDRNQKLVKSINENVRFNKWKKTQDSITIFGEVFDDLILFDNSQNYLLVREELEECCLRINDFLSGNYYTRVAFDILTENTRSTFKKFNNGIRAEGPGDVTPDNRASGTFDNIKDTNPKKLKGYTFRTYHEQNEPLLTLRPNPPEPNFSMDNDRKKKKRYSDTPTITQRIRNIAGIGQEYDTRQQGTVYPMSGLGDVTYKEQKDFRYFRKLLSDSVFSPDATDSGVGGVLGGSGNKEEMDSYKDVNRNIKNDYGIKIKKKRGKFNV